MVYYTRQFVVCLSVCHFVLVFFSPFSIPGLFSYLFSEVYRLANQFRRENADVVSDKLVENDAGELSMSEKGKRKVQGVPQSQTAAHPRPQEEEETDKSKQAQTEQTYEKH